MNPNKALTSKDPILKDASSDLTRVQCGQVTIQVLWVCSLLWTKRSTLGRALQVNPKAQLLLWFHTLHGQFCSIQFFWSSSWLCLKILMLNPLVYHHAQYRFCLPSWNQKKTIFETHCLVLYSSVSSVYHRKMLIVTI